MRQQSASVRGFPAICHFKMADKRERRVKDRLEYKVLHFTLSLNVEANLEAMKNPAVSVER